LVLAFWDYTDWMTCFVVEGDSLRSLGLVGEMAPIQRTSLGTDKVGIRLPLQARKKSVFYLRNLNYYGYITFKLPVFYTSVGYFKKITAWQFDFKMPMSVLIGIFLSQIVFLIVRMVMMHRFQWSYFLYILCCFNFIVFIAFQSQFLNLDGEEFASSYGGRLFCTRIGTVIYGLFYIFFLELYTKSRWRFWLCLSASGLIFILSLVGLVASFQFEGDAVQYYCNKIYQIGNLTILALILSYLLVHRQGATKFLLYGVSALLGTYLWLLFVNYFDRNNDLPTYLHHHLIMMYGVAVESFFFITALLRRDGEIKAERRQQIINERNRIAYDLHDDLGSGLTTIALLSEKLQFDIKNVEIKARIEKITFQANDLMGKMSTIIWVLNSQNDTLESLINYLRRYAFEYLQETHNLNLTFPLPELPPSVSTQKLSGETRRELFLAFKETLHNIIKHANSKHVDIVILLKDNELSIRIDDNGQGFVTENLVGNGLKNMAQRMTKLGGTFDIFSNKKGGMTVVLILVID
jgi:signal transduction histidine kinase